MKSEYECSKRQAELFCVTYISSVIIRVIASGCIRKNDLKKKKDPPTIVITRSDYTSIAMNLEVM